MIDFNDYPKEQPLNIIIGAGEQSYEGWIATNQEDLDLLQPDMWKQRFGNRLADAFLCEHVWEHLTESQGREAAKLCFKYLKPNGYLRCAVPDANFPNDEYQAMVKIGGPGPKDHPAADHKIVYEYQLFSEIFSSVGFEVDLLEYCHESGRFHYNQWSFEQGRIYRSLLSDHRNKDGELGFTSLILDARKPI